MKNPEDLKQLIENIQYKISRLRDGKNFDLRYSLRNGKRIMIFQKGVKHLNKEHGWDWLKPELVDAPIVLKWLANKNNLKRVKRDIQKLDLIDRCFSCYRDIKIINDVAKLDLTWFEKLSQNDLMSKTVKQIESTYFKLKWALQKAEIRVEVAQENAIRHANEILENLQ